MNLEMTINKKSKDFLPPDTTNKKVFENQKKVGI